MNQYLAYKRLNDNYINCFSALLRTISTSHFILYGSANWKGSRAYIVVLSTTCWQTCQIGVCSRCLLGQCAASRAGWEYNDIISVLWYETFAWDFCKSWYPDMAFAAPFPGFKGCITVTWGKIWGSTFHSSSSSFEFTQEYTKIGGLMWLFYIDYFCIELPENMQYHEIYR